MIPDNHAKSFLSKSYINAVVTQAGFGCQFSDPDYGVDARISEIQYITETMYVPSGFELNVQLKASHNYKKQDQYIVYALDADAYNRLVYHTGGLIVLILVCMPEDPEDRIFVTEDALELRNCSYWYIVRGEITQNTSSKTIYIPRTQVFNPSACISLMDCVKSGQWKEGTL